MANPYQAAWRAATRPSSGVALEPAQHAVGHLVRGAQSHSDEVQVSVATASTAARLASSWPVANISAV